MDLTHLFIHWSNMNLIYQYNHLKIAIESKPIGGYRGKVGTLTVSHANYLVFTEWSKEDLTNLAAITQKILQIHEKEHISNSLIFGRQRAITFVPYPRCNWYEKVQGAYHAIFGSSILKQNQIDQISQFYRTAFKNMDFESDIESLPTLEKPLKKPADPFCKDVVLSKQRIATVSKEGENYEILHDNRPKGRLKKDPHILIIPSAESGHVDGSKVPLKRRIHMLELVQKTMQIFEKEKFKDCLYLERNGKKLQSVPHKHSHIIGIQFPKNRWERIRAFLRLLLPSALSKPELKKRIDLYKPHFVA
ncbi:putative uncharacterized protein [Parachlamydia acanthamoebae UV-7]|uniref:HIT domain-containing protein n=2 Tax=Parachlamydiaceae TaxID=92713 RepID=F8KW54_PARAV|nr:putative uncharacterized protein [Parachlamydia acanthamoebae UV-7]